MGLSIGGPLMVYHRFSLLKCSSLGYRNMFGRRSLGVQRPYMRPPNDKLTLKQRG